MATVLFTDIVDSTARAATLGDRRWRALLDEHDATFRRELARWRGEEIKSTGDGFLAIFDGPARAVRCATELADAMAAHGIQIRAGLHTGECVRRNDDVQGIAVHIGARVSALARGGEVLVTSTVRDLVIGSGLAFADRGAHRLKGVPNEWRLYAATVAGAEPAVELSEAPPPRPDEALVGRDRELRELTGIVDGALAGRGAVVLVGGEAGIGKTALAETVSRYAQERGAAVAVGRCWESGGAPAYWPWVQALRSYIRATDPRALEPQVGGHATELAAILPELADIVPEGSAAPAPDDEGARFRLFAAIAEFLHRAARAQPLALFLDDVHAADSPSLLLLRYVADELAQARIVILACYRDTEAGSTLAEVLPDLVRAGSAHRVSLDGIPGADTARLLELTTGDVPSPELAARVQAQTAGNPLFAIEIGRLLTADDSLAEPQERLPMPEGVTEVIGRRLQHRSERCREVLVLASIVGREFGIDVMERVSGLGEDELLEALEEAEGARLVGEVPGASGRLRFSHVLMRDVLYDDLPAARRLRLHRRIAEALEELYVRNPEPHLAELAHHYLRAGTGAAEKAIEYATRAGDKAAAQYAFEEAARNYTSALDVLDTTAGPDPDRTCELLLSLGEVLGRAGSEAESRDALKRAAALAEEQGRSDRLARAAIAYGGRFGWLRGSTDSALVPLIERALAAIGESDDPRRVRLLARLGAALRDEPRRDRRAALADEAVAVATRLGDPAALSYALTAHFLANEGPDTAGFGIAEGAQVVALSEQTGDREQAFMGHDFRLQALWQRCDRAGVDVEFEILEKMAEEMRQPAQRWWVSACRTMIVLMEGQFARAEGLIPETAALGRRAAGWNASVSERLQLFVLLHAQGRLAELEPTIGRSVHEYPALPRFRFALAHLLAELGRVGEARAILDGVLSGDVAHEHLDGEWLFGVNLLADACAALADEGAAAKLYALLLPYERLYARAPIEAAFGCVARSLGVLATTVRDYHAAERHYADAIEIEKRMRARPWLAHAQHGLAAMLLARGGPGDRERAEVVGGEAMDAYRALGMETWAARLSAVAQSSSRS